LYYIPQRAAITCVTGATAGAKDNTTIAVTERGEELARLSMATIHVVAQGVIGAAFIQAIIIGVCLLVAGMPWAGAIVLIELVLGIAQVPGAHRDPVRHWPHLVERGLRPRRGRPPYRAALCRERGSHARRAAARMSHLCHSRPPGRCVFLTKSCNRLNSG
jgi:hypothetical protein